MVYDSQVRAAIAAGAGAVLAWEELPMIVDPSQDWDYTWNSDGGEVIGALAHAAYCMVSHNMSLPCVAMSEYGYHQEQPTGWLCPGLGTHAS